MTYDVAVLGGGPAGMTSALYAVRSGLSTVLLEQLGFGGQMAQTPKLENYPGFPEGVSGFDLAQDMGKQAKEFGVEVRMAQATSVDLASDPKAVRTPDGDVLARSVVVATGVESRRLGCPGEQEYAGRGVSYCATCDGNFFRGKDVAVVGGGNSAAVDALYLARICRKVYLVHRRGELRASHIDVERLKAADNVEFVLDSVVDRIEGDQAKVTGVAVRPVAGGQSRTVPVSAVFVAVGKVPTTAFLGGQLDLAEDGAVKADDKLATSVPGVFAAGDVRQKSVRQVATAVGDGAVAAKSALAYLSGR